MQKKCFVGDRGMNYLGESNMKYRETWVVDKFCETFPFQYIVVPQMCQALNSFTDKIPNS